MALAIEPRIKLNQKFPCHPEIAMPSEDTKWFTCSKCGTRVRSGQLWAVIYSDEYPAARGHHDPIVGECKVRTLSRWLDHLRINVTGAVVCEIGFGGAFCLAALQSRGANVYGIEPVPANLEHAHSLGIPIDHLFGVDPLPNLPRTVDLWLLQDSFEHVPNPNQLAQWMLGHSSSRARILLVAPNVDSLSRKIMGRFWIHEVADHSVHYSRSGIVSIFSRAGFRLAREFRPVKLISLGMVLSHLRLLARVPAEARPEPSLAPRVWFNIGEMGLLLQRDDG